MPADQVICCVEPEEYFGTHPTQCCHEWNTTAHLTRVRSRPTPAALYPGRSAMFFDHADDQTLTPAAAGRERWPHTGTRPCSRSSTGGDCDGRKRCSWTSRTGTGSHPEYVTRQEIDALHEFTADGGRLVYLGGNGFFATTSFDPEQRHIVEIRRADGGTRPHQSPYAERRHTTSGEEAGIWRNKGEAPQRLVGVGTTAQGFDRSTHYQRLVDSLDPRAAFILEGIAENEKIGDFSIKIRTTLPLLLAMCSNASGKMNRSNRFWPTGDIRRCRHPHRPDLRWPC